jgi:hypothetical protein
MRLRAWAAFSALSFQFIAVASWSGVALAQDKDSDAERLFREGQKLMEERRYGDACPKLEAAYKKDQQLGTLLNLAYCHKEQGATWQAWIEFKEAEIKAIEAKRNDRRDFAQKRMAELEKSLGRVVVDVPTKIELTEVLVEDRSIPEAEKGAPFAAEPGQRKFTFRARGKKPAVALVNVVKADRYQRVAVPEMQDQPKEKEKEVSPPADVSPAPSKRVDAGATSAPPSSGTFASRADTPQRTAAYVAGGVGLVGIAVGSVFGLLTFGNGYAPPKQAGSCPAEERGKGSDQAALSTGAFLVGGVALVAGAALWLTAPKAVTTAARWLAVPAF